VSGDSQLNFLFRGADMEVGTFAQTEFQSKFSGNVIEICPVGALLSRTYRFKARPWDLLTQKSICTQCSNGCNIKLDYRVSKLQRVNARENDYVNEEWTCDKGKFGMDYVSADDRLTKPMIRQGNAFHPASWEDAIQLVLRHVREAGTAIGGIGGSRTPNEDLYVWQRFFRERLGVNNLDHRMGPHFSATSGGLFARFGYHTMGQSITDLENMKTILVFGSNLVDEQPILFLRVRKAWRFKGARVVEAVPRTLSEDRFPNHVSEFASASLRYQPGSEIALIGGMLNVLVSEKLLVDENGAPLPGADALKSSDLSAWTTAKAAGETGLTEEAIERAARLLAGGRLSILAGNYVTAHPHAEDVLKALGDLAEATGNAGRLNVPVTENNQQGAMDMGILPDSLPGYAPAGTPGLNTEQMLRAAASGELKMLWVVGGDVVNEFHDRDIAVRGLENSPFTVVHALTLNDTAKMADVVLPVQSVAEREGTFTNVERRVLRFYMAFEISPDILPDWFVFAQSAGLMGQPLPYTSSRDILRDIAASVPIYKDCGPRQLGDLGVRWEY
jgi:NADH-quinone oxidoreductase subunit G